MGGNCRRTRLEPCGVDMTPRILLALIITLAAVGTYAAVSAEHRYALEDRV